MTEKEKQQLLEKVNKLKELLESKSIRKDIVQVRGVDYWMYLTPDGEYSEKTDGFVRISEFIDSVNGAIHNDIDNESAPFLKDIKYLLKDDNFFEEKYNPFDTFLQETPNLFDGRTPGIYLEQPYRK